MPTESTTKHDYPEPLAKGAIFVEFHEGLEGPTITLASLMTPEREGGRWRPVDRMSLEPGDEASDAVLGALVRRLMRRLAKDVTRRNQGRVRVQHAALRKEIGRGA